MNLAHDLYILLCPVGTTLMKARKCKAAVIVQAEMSPNFGFDEGVLTIVSKSKTIMRLQQSCGETVLPQQRYPL